MRYALKPLYRLSPDARSLDRRRGDHSPPMIGRTFRATFHKGRIEPREPLEFSEGAELVVTVEEAEENKSTPEKRPNI